VAKGEELIRQALEAYPPGSDRLPGAYVSYADVLTELGEFDRAHEVLDRAAVLTAPERFDKVRGEIEYVRAELAAHKRDPQETERLLLEVERMAADQDWFKTHIGTTFLLEAAEMLDRVGLAEEAQRYFERARQRAGDGNDEVAQTRAVMRARSGDPEQALEDLQRLARGDWLEKRVVWRHTLLIAWATFRAGRAGAGEMAARALQQAQNCGTYRIASSAEPEIVGALAPLAARTGSVLARELILRDREIMLRLFGRPTLTRIDGDPIELPPGMPGELVRMLAIHEHGLPLDVVLETLFRDVPADTARTRLRQILRRLRTAIGDVVVRDGESLCLIPAWIDVREFLSAAHRMPAEQGPRRVLFAYCALALHGGALLPNDIYAEWADGIREEVRSRHLAMLDLVAADAGSRDSHHEALTALEAAVAEDPDERSRHTAITEHLRALGRNQAADHYARRANEVRPPS
jgi:DNA-binding SARP family transcriptional activator